MRVWEQEKSDAAPEITVIGAGIVDILAGPVSEKVFVTGSEPVDTVRYSFGGDALNEAVVLSRLGKRVNLVSKVGKDETGRQVLDFLERNLVHTDCVTVQDGLQTGMNIVLIGQDAERYFLTNPKSSLRMLSKEDILPHIDRMGRIVSFASLFVSHRMSLADTEEVFRAVKESGRILAADMTTAKHGETVEDLADILPYVDVLFANEKEAALLAGAETCIREAPQGDRKEAYPGAVPAAGYAERFVRAGVTCAVVKQGSRGAWIQEGEKGFAIPAYPVHHAVDTTGAGDCFAAGFLWALAEGYPMERCGLFAGAVASCCVEQAGATTGITGAKEPMLRLREMEKWRTT